MHHRPKMSLHDKDLLIASPHCIRTRYHLCGPNLWFSG